MRPSAFFLALVTVAGLGGIAGAQSALDVSSLEEIEDIDVVHADGSEVGEIEEVLIDQEGSIVAVIVEMGGVFGVGGDEVVFPIENLTFERGNYVTTFSQAEIEALTSYDD